MCGLPAISKCQPLAIRPRIIQPIAPTETDTIDTLYSTFDVPVGVCTQLNSHGTWLVLAGRQNAEVLLTEPGYSDELSADGNFTFYKDALGTYPASGWQVLTMSDSAFASHVGLIAGKLATPYADHDVSLFQTATAKGIIRYGSAELSPNVISIAVWDTKLNFSQEITITVSDGELCERIALSIAASYAFKLNVIPNRDQLSKMMKRAAEGFGVRAGRQLRASEF